MSKLWPPFSVTRKPCSALTGVEFQGIESVVVSLSFFFVSQVLHDRAMLSMFS